MKTTPAICGGRVPLTVRLLAPNRRPVQVTQDLAGFWERHYPNCAASCSAATPNTPGPNPRNSVPPVGLTDYLPQKLRHQISRISQIKLSVLLT